MRSAPYCKTDLSRDEDLDSFFFELDFGVTVNKLSNASNGSSLPSSSISESPPASASSILPESFVRFTPSARKMRIARHSVEDITDRSICSVPARESSPLMSIESSSARSIICLVRGV